MKAIITSRDGGWVVEAYFEKDSSYGQYKPLKNFGCRQSDAIDFRNDINNGLYNDYRLLALAKSYNKDTKYIRVNADKFKKQ